ncbi:HvfC family RiPP maturation protein [Zhongshania sp. BJYM1]|uniref:HvfC family RiPP maturation protein n=1 Tax=Zhongshania aquatica TaxID=2965069 RepID=UPI0022B41CE9|nr:putative DNA-binding domain-containing protein [Marortus sp. BJYM1]
MSELQAIQRELTEFIRDPEHCAGPKGLESRRLDIYKGLFFNNINSFLSNGFPVCRSLFSDDDWDALVRDFMIKHQCVSPYFLKIAEEFLAYLSSQRGACEIDPPFLLELAHYEWVELALDVANEDLPPEETLPADLLAAYLGISPLAWSLAYRFPVHLISRDNRPLEPGDMPTYIVVYRNRHDSVQFLEINAVTARLLDLIGGDTPQSGETVLQRIADELGLSPDSILDFGQKILAQLFNLDILIIARP